MLYQRNHLYSALSNVSLIPLYFSLFLHRHRHRRPRSLTAVSWVECMCLCCVFSLLVYKFSRFFQPLVSCSGTLPLALQSNPRQEMLLRHCSLWIDQTWQAQRRENTEREYWERILLTSRSASDSRPRTSRACCCPTWSPIFTDFSMVYDPVEVSTFRTILAL